MNASWKAIYCHRKGSVLIISMIFVTMFSAFAVSLFSLSSSQVQVANNHHKTNNALVAAQSGLECIRYIAKTASMPETNNNTITTAQANTVWTALQSRMQSLSLGGQTVSASTFTDSVGSGDELKIDGISLGSNSGTFSICFYRYTDEPAEIKAYSSGADGQVTRTIAVNMSLEKESKVLEYAIASRGRMWLTGDTTIYGDVFSAWNRDDIAPFNMTSDSAIEGSVNTTLELDNIETRNAFQFETLNNNDKPTFTFGETAYNADGEAISATIGTIDEKYYTTDADGDKILNQQDSYDMVDASGNPVYNVDGDRLTANFNNRIVSNGDELQGYHENVGYKTPYQDMPGMDISDYDTSAYTTGLTTLDIPTTTTTTTEWVNEGTYWNPNWVEQEVTQTTEDYVYERFPHDADSYTTGSGISLKRYVYENQTITDAYLPKDRNALFENCTFEGVLYIDCHATSQSSGYCNNVRFNNCTFNGVIVTGVPDDLQWQRNALYFTGEATYNNTSDIQEATILAPHFNVNLGNTNPQQSESNVLTGAIVGGIVDVRGNAKIYGTIISMCDTTRWSSGYVTNIGATLNDGGSETTSIGDIGTIEITPEVTNMLPSGITSPIVLKPDFGTYTESI